MELQQQVQKLEVKIASLETNVSSVLSGIERLTGVMEDNTKAVTSNEATMQVFITKHRNLSEQLADAKAAHKEEIKEAKQETKELAALVGILTRQVDGHHPVVENFKKIHNAVLIALLTFVCTLIGMLAFLVKTGGTNGISS